MVNCLNCGANSTNKKTCIYCGSELKAKMEVVKSCMGRFKVLKNTHLIGDMNRIGYADNCLIDGDMNRVKNHRGTVFKGDFNRF